MARKKGGRPSEMTGEKVKKLEEVFALDGTVEEACFYADISKQTYYNWLEKNPELVDRFEALRQTPILKARKTVVRALSNPNIAMSYLERKRKAEFSVRQEIEHSTPPDKQFNVKISTIDGDKLATNEKAE
jgi:hypothetical protein